MSDNEEVFMEDDEAKERSERNPQGSDKRAPDHKQGESVPEGTNDADADTTSGTTSGASGSPAQEGADAGGASYGGGTGNP
jgi:hypothetical protein